MNKLWLDAQSKVDVKVADTKFLMIRNIFDSEEKAGNPQASGLGHQLNYSTNVNMKYELSISLESFRSL